MKKEKKYLIYGIALVLVTLIGVSLSYFVARIEGDKKQIGVSTADLKIIFNNGEAISGENIDPGWSITKTFSIENRSDDVFKYNISIEDLVNTFVTTGYLQYKITSSNGYNMTEYMDIPKSDSPVDVTLAYKIEIPQGVIQEYTIEIVYRSDESIDQSVDMGKTLTGLLYIEEFKTLTLAEAMLRDNPTISERTDFSVINEEYTTGTLYQTNKTEDRSTVYYYSGNTTNNWVKFGKENKISCTYNGKEVIYYDLSSQRTKNIISEEMCTSTNICDFDGGYYIGYTEESCTEDGGTWLSEKATYNGIEMDIYWRIIRTNEDSSVRLLYSGNTFNTIDGYIGHSSYNVFNDDEENQIYVGYMYGTTGSLANNRLNTNDSEMKKVIDNWYKNNLLTNYDKYISKSAIYCNDRSIGDEIDFYSSSYVRIKSLSSPSYRCGDNGNGGLFESGQAIEDKFSASTTGGGNGQLKYSIALMTADEVAFAGGNFVGKKISSNQWYNINSNGEIIIGGSFWWTMSPVYSAYNTSKDSAYVWSIAGSYNADFLEFTDCKYHYRDMVIRPVISIDKCATVYSGDGTPDNPYTIDESSCN